SFFSGRTLSLVDAGFAANQVSSVVNGWMPLPFGLAGTFTAVIFSTPGSTNWPAPFLLMEAWIAPSRAASTARTSLAATWLASAMCATSPDLFRASLIGFGAAALAGAFLAGAAFFLAICVDSSVSWLRVGWPEWITVRCGGISRGEFHRRLCHQYDHAGEAAQPGEAAQLVDGGQVEDPVQDAEGDERDREQADALRVHAGELRHQHRRGERRECLEGVEVGGVGVADAVAVLLRQPAARVLVVVAGCAALGDEGPCIGQQGGDQDAPVGNRHVGTPRAGAMAARLADPNARGAVFRLVSGNFFRAGRRRGRRAHGIARRLERVAIVPVRPLPAVGQRPADRFDGLQVLDDAVQLPGRGVVFVAGLVVAVVRVVLRGRLAGGLAAVDQGGAAVDVQRRHPGLGEVEMVGAEVIAGGGIAFADHLPALPVELGPQQVLQL